MVIQKATANDHEILTAITKKSKAFWGYSDEQLEAWSEALTITKVYIETNTVYKLVIEEGIIGYYSFFPEDDNTIKLDNIFLLPEYIGKGFGKMLMDDFLIRIKTTAANSIYLEVDPNAEAFYAKLGFIKVGQIETSIPGRYLPVMELNVR
jgi:GNAT superfamily N-acetyltransferase